MSSLHQKKLCSVLIAIVSPAVITLMPFLVMAAETAEKALVYHIVAPALKSWAPETAVANKGASQ